MGVAGLLGRRPLCGWSCPSRGPGAARLRSCWGQPPGLYHLELEVADSDEGYATTGLEEALTLAVAVDLVSEHLSAKEA